MALAKLLPMQRGDFEGIFEAMDGYGVTVRLLTCRCMSLYLIRLLHRKSLQQRWVSHSKRLRQR